MRIVGGAWRGRKLIAPPGEGTRPTADRVRQALFDMIMHAAWGGRALIEGTHILDVFAGTGALGLEALSRGAATACFIERDPAALRALRANIASCGAAARAEVVAVDALSLAAGRFAAVAFLDPPYGLNLITSALGRLRDLRCVTPSTVIVAETGRDEPWVPIGPVMAERVYGAVRIVVFRIE